MKNARYTTLLKNLTRSALPVVGLLAAMTIQAAAQIPVTAAGRIIDPDERQRDTLVYRKLERPAERPSANPRGFAEPFVTGSELQPARTAFVSYRSVKDALAADPAASQNVIDLNGEWSYRVFNDGISVMLLGEISDSVADLSTWQTVGLPQPREMHDGSHRVIWSDKAYDFVTYTATKPKVPAGQSTIDKNYYGSQVTEPYPALPVPMPTIVYSRYFTVPFDLADRALFLNIGAVSGSVQVWVNGQMAGYSARSSKDPVEFNISPYIERGKNRVMLVVEKYGPGALLEDQPGWRLSGVTGNISVFAQPKIRIRDYIANGSLDPSHTNGLLETGLIIKSELLNTHDIAVYYQLFDPDGKLVGENWREATIGMQNEDTVHFAVPVPNAVKWSASEPKLYTVTFRVQRDGRVTECIAFKAGFRTAEVRDDKLYINGSAIDIKGIDLAGVLSIPQVANDTALMRNVLKQIKGKGYNFVRTGGRAIPARLYDMCDELGLYVSAVADINSAGLDNSLNKGGSLTNDPAWCDAIVQRIQAMYEGAKTHPSVVLLEMGENAGNGYNMQQGYLALRALERSRPIVYNSAGNQWNSDMAFEPSKLFVQWPYRYDFGSGIETVALTDDYRADNGTAAQQQELLTAVPDEPVPAPAAKKGKKQKSAPAPQEGGDLFNRR